MTCVKHASAMLALLIVLMMAAGCSRPEETRVSNPFGMRFVAIPPGSFLMGSPASEPERDPIEVQHRVTLTRGFYLQATEVTQGQWKAVMDGANPAGFRECGDECPVDSLSWELIQAFLTRLNQLDAQRSYRLPTEAEWEYAARAGSSTPFATGDCLTHEQASINGENPMPGCPPGPFQLGPVRVASFAPNAWGLYDMHGNVWEMTQDWFGPYPSEAVVDPAGPPRGEYRVVRGASWRMDARFARSANRFQNIRDFAGLRLVMTPRQQ